MKRLRSDPTVHVIPSINELIDGWFIDFSDSIDPPVIHKDIEKYFIKSSNRTCDDQKMAYVTVSTYMGTSIVKKNTYTR